MDDCKWLITVRALPRGPAVPGRGVEGVVFDIVADPLVLGGTVPSVVLDLLLPGAFLAVLLTLVGLFLLHHPSSPLLPSNIQEACGEGILDTSDPLPEPTTTAAPPSPGEDRTPARSKTPRSMSRRLASRSARKDS